MQLSEAKDKLASLTHSLKSVQVCGKGKIELCICIVSRYCHCGLFPFFASTVVFFCKNLRILLYFLPSFSPWILFNSVVDCQLTSKDLILNYDCMTKVSVFLLLLLSWDPEELEIGYRGKIDCLLRSSTWILNMDWIRRQWQCRRDKWCCRYCGTTCCKHLKFLKIQIQTFVDLKFFLNTFNNPK